MDISAVAFRNEAVNRQGDFDCVAASRSEATSPLRMTGYEFFRSLGSDFFPQTRESLSRPFLGEHCGDSLKHVLCLVTPPGGDNFINFTFDALVEVASQV